MLDSFINNNGYDNDGTTQAMNTYSLPFPSHQEDPEEFARKLRKRYACRGPSLSSEVQSKTNPSSRPEFWMVQVPVSL
jgi:hypothetical protein